MKVLIAYPNLPLMYQPSVAVAILTAICKNKGCDVDLFETTQYSDEYQNRHMIMAEVGSVRINDDDENKIFHNIKAEAQIIPDFVDKVKKFKPDLILLSLQEDVLSIGLKMLKSIKHLNIPHLIGGVFAINDPSYLMKQSIVKNICNLEGESVVEDFIDHVQYKKPLRNIRGIWWKDEDSKVHKNAPAPLVDINKYTPDFSLFELNRWQRWMGGKKFECVMGMETYRGCPYKCTFCNSPKTRQLSKEFGTGNYLRTKNAETIKKELDYYVKEFNPQLVSFVDDSFLARPRREILEFCEVWSKYKIPFWFNTRIENCKPDILQALKDVGLYRMTFGIEAGNPEYRAKVLKRPIPQEKYLEYKDYINDSDIPYSLNAIIGMPFETRELILETAALIREFKGHDGILISKFIPYRGTELRTVAVKAGFLNQDFLNTDGYLTMGEDTAALRMPKPYIQSDEIDRLVKCFSLYAFYPDSMWHLVQQAEFDEKLYNKLMKEYRSKFFIGNYQVGGKTKLAHLNKYCAAHDISSSYDFQVVA
jgi:radical SAM superfamily enzyme YgiQ (UPF0313 family)